MDVGWSPIHPALFASADLTGKLSFWNLNTDTEVGNFLKITLTLIKGTNIIDSSGYRYGFCT